MSGFPTVSSLAAASCGTRVPAQASRGRRAGCCPGTKARRIIPSGRACQPHAPRLCVGRAVGEWPGRREYGLQATLEPQAEKGADSGEQEPLDPAEREACLFRALGLISNYNQLAPFDPKAYNPAILLWKEIKGLEAEDKLEMLNQLSLKDILNVWNMSKRLPSAAPDQVASIIGPEFSLWDQFPNVPGQVAVYEGRASVPVASYLGLDGFQKAFFKHPKTSKLMGRVLINRGTVGDVLYPLYFQADLTKTVIPNTGEVVDLCLDYKDPDDLPLSLGDLPDPGWPRPGPHRYPFNGGLVDYMRPVGPGVFVGCGWKEKPTSGLVGERFLTFVLVRRPDVEENILC